MPQNVDKYRKFLHDLKRAQLKKYNVDDVKDLLDKLKPALMRSDAIWRRYLDHWDTPEQRAKSAQNKKKRDKMQGMSHGYGRKSAPARLHHTEIEGKKLSMMKVMLEVNKVRDERRNLIGRVHHRGLHDAIDEYREMYEQAKP